MEFLSWLQESSIAIWVAESESLWAYPTILALHTFGLAFLVGANVVIDFRLLGLSRDTPIGPLKKLFPTMWVGLAINTVTGLLLFAASARLKAVMIMFYIKLGCIALALIAAVRIRRVVFDAAAEPASAVPDGARRLAVLSIVLWTGAIIAGRLMAYVKWNFGG